MDPLIEQWVWFYWNNGFSIIPLGVNEKNDLKAPSLKSWREYHNRLPTKDEITEWMNKGLFKNIGIICGNVSNNLVVIDIDDDSIPETIGLKLDKIMATGSWVAKTGKGYHIYCKHTGNPGGIKKPIKYKIEYRANRGYVAAPPSIHPNGSPYKFFTNGSPQRLPALQTKDVKEIFMQMKEKIADKWNIKEDKKIKTSGSIDEARGYPLCVEQAMQTVTKQGTRHDIIYGIASSFAFKEIPYDMAIKKIKQFNLERCIPPLDKRELESYVESAYKKGAKRYGCEFWIDQIGCCPFEDITQCSYGNRKHKRELASKYKIFKYSEQKHHETQETFYVKTGVHPQRLARLIINEYDYNFITTKDNKEIYYYNGGRYHTQGDTIIRSLSQEYMGDISTAHYKNEIEDYIKDSNYVDRNEVFTTDPNLINVKNGVYNIKTGELLPHSNTYYFLNELPVEYNPEKDCPLIKKFISEVVYENDIACLQEFIGYCLYRKYNIHKAFMFIGEGKNGKSTFINLLTKFVGERNVANKDLQGIIYNRFDIAALYGKLINAAADISNQALNQTGKFKELTGEDRVDAEQKYRDSFNFVNYAKFIFSANQLPAAKDDTYAFFRRWVLISFPNTFVGKKCDPNLIEKLTTKDELSGLLNWALEGLHRLLKNGDFSYNLSVDQVMERYKRLSDPEYAYVQEFLKCDMKQDARIIKDELYSHYVKWCTENNLPVTPKNMLTQKLTRHLPDIENGRPKINGKRVTTYEHISWKSELNDVFKLDNMNNNRKNADLTRISQEYDEFTSNPDTDEQQEETL